jgi:hypothetical protein
VIGFGAFRLAWRLQRWEIVFVAIVCLGLAAVALWLTADMRSILALCGTPAATKACEVTFAFQDTHGEQVILTQMAIGYAPFVAGLVLGVPIVAHEVEQRTALVTWPIARTRLRWLVWRLVPIGVIGLALVSVLAFAADQLARAYFPHNDVGFLEYGSRDVPMVMRALVMLFVGVALGAVIGRLLPALLLGVGVAVGLSIVLSLALPLWVASTQLSEAEVDAVVGPMRTEIRYRLPDESMVDAQRGEILIAQAYEATDGHPDLSSLPQEVAYGVSASRYPDVVTRESAALGAVTLMLGGIAAFALGTRRPE